MISKKIAALLASAVLVATTSAAAQTLPAAALLQAVEVEDTGSNNTGVLLGAGFALAAFVAIVYLSDEGEDDPVSA